MGKSDDNSPGQDALSIFLSQPAPEPERERETSHDETARAIARAPALPLRRRWAAYLFEKKLSSSSSLVPRTSTGERTRVFPFNGNGRGR